jgi:pimeloyl-ACP methyl ester carboxylesterase
MTERMIDTTDVELCTESFGDPAAPPVLLIMGIGGSMLWWEEGFCRMLAAGRRFVIRYDHRDTGRSVTYQHGQPEYTGGELVADAVGVLDAYGVPAAHIVGVSAGAACAQLLVLDYPDRVLSLVLISSSPATPGDPDRARRGAGRGDLRGQAPATGGSWPWGRARRLIEDRPRDPRAHRRHDRAG